MLIPSRAWGFLRVGRNGRFGVTVPEFGVGGDFDNPLLNDVDAGDESAGVEFCPVFASQPGSGALTVWTDGSLALVGAADGTYSIPYDLYTFTPGDGAAVDEGGTTFEVTVGATATASSGAGSVVIVSAAGAGSATEEASSGAAAAGSGADGSSRRRAYLGPRDRSDSYTPEDAQQPGAEPSPPVAPVEHAAKTAAPAPAIPSTPAIPAALPAPVMPRPAPVAAEFAQPAQIDPPPVDVVALLRELVVARAAADAALADVVMRLDDMEAMQAAAVLLDS